MAFIVRTNGLNDLNNIKETQHSLRKSIMHLQRGRRPVVECVQHFWTNMTVARRSSGKMVRDDNKFVRHSGKCGSIGRNSSLAYYKCMWNSLSNVICIIPVGHSDLVILLLILHIYADVWKIT